MNWMLILKYLVALCAVLSFGLNIVVIVYLFLRHKTRREEIITTIINSQRLKSSISRQISNINIPLSPTTKELIKKEIIDEIRYLQQLDKTENYSKISSGTVDANYQSTPIVEKKIYYATAVNEENQHTFYSVSDTPTKGESIFKLTELQADLCEFEVYVDAYSLILQEPEYLRGACSVEKTGNVNITTIQKGLAERTIDGKWIIKKQAKIKIE
jgi:hypothetical protein